MAGSSEELTGSEQAHKDFRAQGYQTISEFVDKFAEGLRAYMDRNWPDHNADILHHPEDLASNVLCYAEAVHTAIQTFGAGDTNVISNKF